MYAARDFDPAAVRPRGGHYIIGRFVTDVGYEGRGDIEVRRPSDNQPYGQIPDAGPEGVDQAVRFAQDALKESGWSTHADDTCAVRGRAGSVFRASNIK